MIALASFVVAGTTCWAHYTWIGATVFASIRVWHVWIFCTLLGAAVDAYRSQDREIRLAWCALCFSWFGGLLPWAFSSQPLIDLTIKNLIVMMGLLIIAVRPETLVPVLLHGLVIIAAFMAAQGLIPGAAQRSRTFLAWSYPDIAAGLQHASLVFIGGYGAARRIVLDWRNRTRHMDHVQGLSGVARDAQSPKD